MSRNGSMTPETPGASHFRLALQSELVRRCKANPKYSLRAFAKRLQIEPSFLSKLLSGKRSCTPALIQKLGPELGLSPNEVKRYSEMHSRKTAVEALVEAQEGRKATQSDLEFQQLTLDAFQIVADWYHYAILELVTVRGFQPNAKWVAKSLGITVGEANAAVERLVRVGMLKVEGKSWVCTGNHTTIGNAFSAAAFRKLQAQVLAQAQAALENLPMEVRDQSSVTLSIDTQLLAQAKETIRKFRREMVALLQAQGTRPDQVYQLSVSFFPVTQIPTVQTRSQKASKKGEIR
jgi:uncharacterized protein (TIGR02147 family)